MAILFKSGYKYYWNQLKPIENLATFRILVGYTAELCCLPAILTCDELNCPITHHLIGFKLRIWGLAFTKLSWGLPFEQNVWQWHIFALIDIQRACCDTRSIIKPGFSLYTNTQTHKHTNTQIHKYTNTQMCKDCLPSLIFRVADEAMWNLDPEFCL